MSFEFKFHRNYPGEESRHGQISWNFKDISNAILALYDESQKDTFWCKICNRDIFSAIPVHYIPLVTYSLSLFSHVPTRSLGQANYRWKADSSGTSILRRLASRSLAGQSLGIRIHQHLGFQLHMVWHTVDSNNYKSLRCIERVFLKYKDIHDFCMELKMEHLKVYVIVYVVVFSNGWTTKLTHVL